MPFGNLLGFKARLPGSCPEDSVDLFTAFPGRHGSSVSYAVAHQVFQEVLMKSNYLIDLHGGELNESESVPLAWYCETGNPKVDGASKKLAGWFDADYVLDGTKIWFDDHLATLPAGTLMYEAARAGIPSIIGEAGGSGKVSEECVRRLYDGMIRVCQGAGILKGYVSEKSFRGVRDLTLLTTNTDGLLYCFVSPGEIVRAGERLAEVRSWKGDVRQTIVAPFEGLVTITVNWLPVPSGVRRSVGKSGGLERPCD